MVRFCVVSSLPKTIKKNRVNTCMTNCKTLKMKRMITRGEKGTDNRIEKGLGTKDSLLLAGDILLSCSIHGYKYNHISIYKLIFDINI